MVNLLLSMQGGTLNKELHDAGIEVTASAFVQQRNKLSWTIFEVVLNIYDSELQNTQETVTVDAIIVEQIQLGMQRM